MIEFAFIKNFINNLNKKISLIKTNLFIDKIKKIDKKIEKYNNNNINKKYIKKLINKKFYLKKILNKIIKLKKDLNFLEQFIILITKEKNKSLIEEIKKELFFLEKKINLLELNFLFRNKKDKLNCYLNIQSGSGGSESQDWSNILLKMYLKWCENNNFITKIYSENIGEINGIKSATIKIIGKYSYGWLRTETGIHRLVRKSPFNNSNRRHTSFSSVFVYPDIDNNLSIKILAKDLKIDVYRSSGSGGQHVNRTESAVRITHIPTNIITQCQNNRSQHKNKEQALKQLKNKIKKFIKIKKNKEKKLINNSKLDITWGRQIRSYIIDKSIIKDLRTGKKEYNINAVLNGDINKFIIASLKAGL